MLDVGEIGVAAQSGRAREFNSLELVYQNRKRGIFSSTGRRALSLSLSLCRATGSRQRPDILKIRHRQPGERQTTG